MATHLGDFLVISLEDGRKKTYLIAKIGLGCDSRPFL